MQVAKIFDNPDCTGAHLVLGDLNLEDMLPLESFDIGDTLTIKIEEIDEQEFDGLPEFDGF